MKLDMRVSVALIVAAFLPASAIARPATRIVRTESGVVRGASENGSIAWKGIPYAASVAGDNRWRAPQPAAKWAGVRDSTAYGADCMQIPFPSDAAPLGTTPSETCLFANVWRPKAAGARRLPVLFWIHGGGFVNGGSSPPTYSGARLAERGIVVVSINYRLGRFGFMANPALDHGDDRRPHSGNYAVLDQVAALEWTKRNIAAFGGDPNDITLMGESAGGMSVNMLLASPLTEGKFSKAIMMSGADGRMGGDATLAAAQEKARAFADAHGATIDPARLRSVPSGEIMDNLNLATLGKPSTTYSGPYVDGITVNEPRAVLATSDLRRLRVMIGATSSDIGGPSGRMIAGARELGGLLARRGAAVYSYCFSYVAQSSTARGASHASDIPFFFDTQDVKYGSATTARDNAMGKAIASYIVNFVKNGNPNRSGLPDWQKLSSDGAGTIMDFSIDGIAAPRSGACSAS